MAILSDIVRHKMLSKRSEGGDTRLRGGVEILQVWGFLFKEERRSLNPAVERNEKETFSWCCKVVEKVLKS